MRIDSDFPLEAVPASARKSFASLTWVLFGFTFFSATMWTGGRIGAGASGPGELVLVLLGGNLLLGLYVAALAVISQRSGLSAALQLRLSLGRQGNRLAEALLGLTQVGWYAWGTATIARMVADYTGLHGNWEKLFMVAMAILATGSAIWGFRSLKWLSLVSVPLLSAFVVMVVVRAVTDWPAELATPNPAEAISPSKALTIIIGTYVSGGTQVGNWSRFGQRPSHALIAALLAFFVGNGLMIAAGALCGLVYQEADFVTLMGLQGMLGTGVLLLFLNLWTTQNNTIYGFAMAGCAFFGTSRRVLVTVSGCALGLSLAAMGIYEWLVPYLVLMGTTIPPLGGLVMAEHLTRSWHRSPGDQSIRLNALIAYLGGALAAVLLPGVSAVNGVAVAFLLYVAFRRVEHSGERTGGGHRC